MFGLAGHPVASQRFLLDQGVALHSHDFVEVAVVLAGSATHLLGGRSGVVQAGSVLVVRPGQRHGYRDCSSFDVVNLYLGVDLLGSELTWLLDLPNLARLLLRGGEAAGTLDGPARERVSGWLAQLGRLREPGTPTAVMSRGLLICVLGELAALPAGERDGAAPAPISSRVRQAMAMMSDDLTTRWVAADLARRLHVSTSHLQRQFTAQVGVPPLAWLAGQRAERAAVLLIQTDASITEIARRVGWGDANYASRRFREAYGMSPTRYRQAARGTQPARRPASGTNGS